MKIKFPEIFQDVDGGSSMKRLAFFLALLLVIALAIIPIVMPLPKDALKDVLDYARSALNTSVDLVKFLGAYVLGERIPQAIAAWKGTTTPPVSQGQPETK